MESGFIQTTAPAARAGSGRLSVARALAVALPGFLLGAWPAAAVPPAPDPSDHWAFARPGSHPLPEVGRPGWCRTPIDRFVLSGLEAGGLDPGADATPETILRRLTFTLTGLPPAPEDIERFASDAGPEAVAREVDRLLASPQYGERWARVWLDVARYADSNGQDENKAMAHAWRYRDWVVDAFNADLPIDVFIRRQIAGDLEPGLSDEERAAAVTATGFLVLGPKQLAEQDKEKMLLDIVDEQMDTVGRAFLGMTFGCARCHDHVYDPVSQREYYALAGIFRSTRTMANTEFVSQWNERDVATPAERAAWRAHEDAMARIEAESAALAAEADRDLQDRAKANATRLLDAASPGSSREERRPPDPDRGDDAWMDALIERWTTAVREAPEFEGWRRWLASSGADRDAAWLGDPVLATITTKPPKDRIEGVAVLAGAIAAMVGAPAPEGDGTALVPGFRGGAHDGGTGPFDVPHSDVLEPGQLTLEARVRVDRIPSEGDPRRWIVNKNGNEWEAGHYALILSGDRAGAYIATTGGRSRQHAVLSAPGSIRAGRWHHLAATFDGETLSLFVDGAPAGEAAVAEPRRAGSGQLRIAGRADGYSGFAEGAVDEVRVFAEALDPSAVAEHAAGRDSAAAPVAAWDFDPTDEAGARGLALAGLRRLVIGGGAEAPGLFAPPSPAHPHWAAVFRERRDALSARRTRLEEHAPPPLPEVMAVDESQPLNLRLHVRGDHLTLEGEPIPRNVPAAVGRFPANPVPADASGRARLAEWITDPRHPLTARVFINRVWQAHFGSGLVRTPDNFGLSGEPPTHPELLDWLAVEFIRSGWSLKDLHRLILTSRAWSLSSAPNPAAEAIDPENRLLWRMHRRRLDAEMIRDALLAASGRLDLTPGGAPTDFENHEYVPRDPDLRQVTRRALYLPVLRDRLHDEFALFDFAPPSAATGRRDQSVVPLQALYFLNSPFVADCAEAFADRLLSEPIDTEARIRLGTRLAWGRDPADGEIVRARNWIEGAREAAASERHAWSDWCHALLAANEFLYLD